MAELRKLGSRGEDRAQLILVTGFALAFTLVAIVLLLNTTIYTENLASRGIDRSPDEAVEFRVAAEDGLADIITAINEDANHSDSLTDVENQLSKSLTNFSRMMGRSYADRGSIADINNRSFILNDGIILRQDDTSRRLWNASEVGGNWTLATGVGKTRKVHFNLSHDHLQGITNAFRINLSDGTNYWRVYIAGYTNGVRIYVKEDGASRSPALCDIPVNSDYVQIDLSEGTVNGEDCNGYSWWGGDDPGNYEIRFENISVNQGSYSMVLKDGSPYNIPNNYNTTGGNPTYIEGIYSVEVQLEYTTPTLQYTTNVTVSPEAPHNG